MSFEFQRVTFQFLARGDLRLAAGKAANAIRGAFGLALHETAPAEEYARLFAPRATDGPSGLADRPRPFVFRVSHLEGREFRAGDNFAIAVHFFDVANPGVESFRKAFAQWERLGLGPERARVSLEGVEASPPCSISLEAETAERATVRFVTPTELKVEGGIAPRPEFGVLFARVRDRIATLRTLYGAGPLDIDFAGMGERAQVVRMTRCDVEWECAQRRSARTGQVHPLGGFTGEAEYEGALGEFLPWLRAAQFASVGRQTVWGKGELLVIS
jgi:hypothetical protein